jgi:hypothetical protein
MPVRVGRKGTSSMVSVSGHVYKTKVRPPGSVLPKIDRTIGRSFAYPFGGVGRNGSGLQRILLDIP